MQNGYDFINNPFSFQNLIMHPLVWIFFPIFLTKNYFLVLIFQQVFITTGVFPLYGIAKHVLKSKYIALMISLSFLVYPYIAGLYWYNMFYQSLFPTLFLFAYYLYIKSRYKSSIVIFLLSGLTSFPYMLFIVLFSIVILFETVYKRKFEHISLKYPFILFISSSVIFLIMNYSNPSFYGNLYMFMPKYYPFSNIDYKVNVILVLLVPLLAFPVISKKFLIMLIPYFYALFSLTPPNSSLLAYQYAPLAIAFLYLGFIDTLNDFSEDEKIELKTLKDKIKHSLSDIKFKFTALMLILVILFASVYLPIGPFNQYSNSNFNFAENTAANYTAYNELTHIISMIPSNEPYVLTQNNIIEIYPRPLVNGVPLVAGITSFTNLTSDGVYLNLDGKNVYVKINYILADLKSRWYVSGNPSMYNFTSLFYSSGKFGIVAETSGFILLERNYTGPVKYYVPNNIYFPASSLNLGPNTTIKNNVLYANNTKHTILWSTNMFNLAPGTYRFILSIYTNSSFVNNELQFNISANGNPLFQRYNLTGSVFQNTGNWTNISFNITLNSFYNKISITCYSINWNGSIAFKNIALLQDSYRS
ncbi:MAG: DUF2079 domain-containing protein [Thermoprotei archaeon]